MTDEKLLAIAIESAKKAGSLGVVVMKHYCRDDYNLKLKGLITV